MRTLGRYFTFRLSIRSDHKIIQEGPYEIVRNPSYTGIYLMTFGMTLIMQTGKTATKIAALTAVPAVVPWLLGAAFTFLFAHGSFRPRMVSEEKMLKETFGSDWVDYTRKVPYRLFPGIW